MYISLANKIVVVGVVEVATTAAMPFDRLHTSRVRRLGDKRNLS